MSEKFLCLLATFDEETEKYMKGIERTINETGIVGKQTPNLSHHITMAYYDTNREEEIKKLLEEVCLKTKSFNLTFNHIGLFDLSVIFFAPDVNRELLSLHEEFDKEFINNDKGWTPHATIIIDNEENIQKVIPIVANNFMPINARVEKVSLYEFFPTRFIAEYNLQ
ncbi:2'-5' RNA ligase family protein [Clostridium paridis]|uniref:2'-5' RNA ligase family protein n=1 Tax=Clostridium paridis TaxID=2803863 RepID=A0A937K673_9CLOT|nr:2'-5' RNA ligase family protein [Clostridium paridis]MBL4933285.1 2'-5' RNA ligase family protein [Clostridium paridis]